MNASVASAISRLEGIVGAPGFTADPARLANYAIGSLAPAGAVRPSTPEEVAEIVRFANAENLAFVPCGARTKLTIGSPPQRYDIALDLTALNRIAAYDPADLTLAVEPGVTLASLAPALGQHRQFLPLGTPFAARATIGGTVISGVDGPMRQFYGTSRDFLLGMEFITGDGVAGKSGGRVVKNVTGYDLHKPLIGSLGTLAVATRLNFRTFPAPQGMRGFVVYFPGIDGVAALRHAVAKSFLRPLTLEIFGAGASELFLSAAASRFEPNPPPGGLLAAKGWTVATSFAGDDAVLARCEHDLRLFAERTGATAFNVVGGANDRAGLAAVFARIREFVPIALESSPAAAIVKVSVPPAYLGDALCSINHSAEAHSLPSAVLARGVGVIYAALLPTDQPDHSLQRVASSIARITEDAARLDGHCAVPWCPAEWKPRLNVSSVPNDALSLMRKLKSVFDPRSILAPGRFSGGI